MPMTPTWILGRLEDGFSLRRRIDDVAVVSIPGGSFGHADGLIRRWSSRASLNKMETIVVSMGGNSLGRRGGGVAMTTQEWEGERADFDSAISLLVPGRCQIIYVDPVPRYCDDGLFLKVTLTSLLFPYYYLSTKNWPTLHSGCGLYNAMAVE